MDDINNPNGLEKAVRKVVQPLATIDITSWFARCLKKELNANITFCRIDVVEVLRATGKAVQIRGYFNTDVAVNCYCCHAVLDTEISKASGIGPVCAKKAGVPRTSINDAPAIIAHMNQLAQSMGEFTVWVPRKCIKTEINLGQYAPASPLPEVKQLQPGQIQVAAWLAKKNGHPEVLTVISKKKETDRWVLLVTNVGEVGIPKSQILGGAY